MATKGGAPSLSSMSKKAMLEDISSCITKQAQHSTFACGGAIPIKSEAEAGDFKTSKPIALRFNNNGRDQALTLPSQSDDTGSLQDLLAACSPATFARGDQDVFDESYRKAGKLDTKNFVTSFCPYSAGMIDVVTQLPCQMLLVARLVIGSLVVALPVCHKGGELVVRKGGKDVAFDWSSEVSAEEPVLQWAAFYSDCEHEVLEVTAGHRVTLTYNLYAVTPASGQLAGSIDGILDPTRLPLYEPLRVALDTPSFLQGGRVLGVYLTHSYAHTHGLVNFLPNSLKGSAMALYETARALGLTCAVRPLLRVEAPDPKEQETGSDNDNEDKDEEDEEDVIEDGAPLIGDKFHTFDSLYYGGDNDGAEECKEAMQSVYPSKLLDQRKVTWLSTRKSNLTEPALVNPACGNDLSVNMHYSAAVLLIRVPPFGERQAAPKDESALFDGIEKDKGKINGE